MLAGRFLIADRYLIPKHENSVKKLTQSAFLESLRLMVCSEYLSQTIQPLMGGKGVQNYKF